MLMKKFLCILIQAFFLSGLLYSSDENLSAILKKALKFDVRYVENGYPIYNNGYVDQPYIVSLKDGRWFCVFTTSAKEEGSKGQHIVWTISSDCGKSWSKPMPIEPDSGPAASWATPFLTDYGRIYVFYDYNGDNISQLGKRKNIRNDMLGWYCFRYTDDCGKTWSERMRLPMRLTSCDRANDWHGKVQIFWGIDKPDSHSGSLYLAFTKIGKYLLENGEGWVYKCENIHTQKDVSKLDWQLLPQGDAGIRNPAFGSVQEEHNLVPLSNGDLLCVYRTAKGYVAQSYSRDGAKTWTMPEYVSLQPGGRPLKNPRACPKINKFSNGKYVLWFHNHSYGGFFYRNPAWIVGGVERGGVVRWSEPEIAIHDPFNFDSYTSGRFSYPDFIDDGRNFWLSQTQKLTARIHKLDNNMLEDMWNIADGKTPELCNDGLLEEYNRPAAASKDSGLQNPFPGEMSEVKIGKKLTDLRSGGFSIEILVDIENPDRPGVLLDAMNSYYTGIKIEIADARSVRFIMHEKNSTAEIVSDVNSIVKGKNHIVITADGLAKILTTVVNGRLSDGGTRKYKGWERIPFEFSRIPTPPGWQLPQCVEKLRIYSIPLRTNQAVGNYRRFFAE